MTFSLANRLYNSIIILSLLNFVYLYTIPILIKLYNLKVVYPLILIKTHDSYIKNKIIERQNRDEIVNCYNSCIHAFIMLLFSSLYLSNYINIELYNNSLYYTTIYNMLDIHTQITNDSRIKNQMIYHHILIIISTIIPYFIQVPNNYYYYIACNFLSEITTVPLNFSWILYIKNKTDSVRFKLYTAATLLLYIPFRVFLNTYVLYDSYYNLETNLKYCQILITVLNYFWFYKLCKKAYKAVLS